jgi:Protein of unknown function (DUF2489)
MASIIPNEQQWITLANILNGLLSERLNIAEGCREIDRLSFKITNRPDNLFDRFVGYSSLFDEFPLGEVRDLWQSDALAKADKERTRIEAQYREDILEEAKKILDYIKTNKK